MIATQTCDRCGAPLSAGEVHGLCPRCLLGSGLGEEGASAAKRQAPSPADLAPHFPQLEILERVGQGGMGVVYTARQLHLNRIVALKIVHHAAQDGTFTERFEQEARALARLNHPNIVQVYDFGFAEGVHYLIMEHVAGVNLRQVLRARELDPAKALNVVVQICEGLQYAHEQGVVHRDIKPENILLTPDGRVKIADFGLAKVLEPSNIPFTLTGAGDVMGTAHYMAPEQLQTPHDVDHRADIYSLGVVFYEMLTGELPMGRFAAPSEVVPLDHRLDDVVFRTLQNERQKRYQHAGELQTAVRTIAETPHKSGSSGRKRFQAMFTGKHSRRLLYAGAVLLFAAVGLLASGMLGGEPAPKPEPDRDRELNKDQSLYLKWTEETFKDDLQPSDVEKLSGTERARLEDEWIRQLGNGKADDVCSSVNRLAALRSRGAVRSLKRIATSRDEIDNRSRWMAVRALGLIGDEAVVPDLIHLVYHPNQNTRFWAQISLVRLTGVNNASDWEAWGRWWQEKHGKHAFSATLIAWSKDPSLSDRAAQQEADRQTIAQILHKQGGDAPAPGPADTKQPQIVRITPANGQRDVDPNLTEIVVEFDRDMADGFSWCGGGPAYPETTGKPFWRTPRVCVLPVRLVPGKAYSLSINCPSYQGFKSADGESCEPHPLKFQTAAASDAAAAPTESPTPQVVRLEPANGAQGADPGLTELVVEFDRDMAEGFSWCGGGPAYPETTGKPFWRTPRICVLPVRLQPNHEYHLGINCPSARNFRSADGVSAEPLGYSFRTAGR